jgi:uncharacterized protein YecT (DUF1311 family)
MEWFAWVEWFLESNVAKVIVMPILAGGAGFGLYLLKQRIERRKHPDEIGQLNQAIALKEKLDQMQISLYDLKAFRSEALGKPAEAAFVSAEYFLGVAKKLSFDQDQVADQPSMPEGSTQLQMNEAAVAQANQATETLDHVVQGLIDRATPTERVALQRAHDTWVGWRDAEAGREALKWEGGSILPLMVSARVEAITRERIASLELEMQGLEGNQIVDTRLATPSNLLCHVVPGVPAEKVRKWLGTPTSIHGDVWIYRFIETQVQVTFDMDVVREIVVALVHGHVYQGSGAPWGDFTLGTLTVAELQEMGHTFIEYRSSMRTKEAMVPVRVGPAGAWSECICGALVVHSGVGSLAEVEFEWDEEAEKLVSDPSKTLMNWIGMAAGLEPPSLYWFIEG